MSSVLPSSMRAVVLPRYQSDAGEAVRGLEVVQHPVPEPGPGQVLVRIEAAPCNPSDLVLLQGKSGMMKTLPTVPGWEGAGTVVKTGSGLVARWLRGKRVACALTEDRPGTWAEYFLANATECIPLKRRMNIHQGACLIINPLTAMGLLQTARRGGHRGAIHTAAASQLGRMLLVMAAELDFPLICIVRRDAQVQMLRSLGATQVLNSSDADFAQQLSAASRQLSATAAFDAVAGEMTGTLLGAMPAGSRVYVYGELSGEPSGNIDPMDLIYRDKTVNGFFLGHWLQRRNVLLNLRAANRVQNWIIAGRIATQVQRRLVLDEVSEGLRQYLDHMTQGKMLLTPHVG